MVAREYYEWPSIHWICKYIGCIPVNRDGRDFAATRTALRALKAGRVLPIFPEGHIVPASGRRLDEMKPGTAYLAIHARVPVIPAYIYGTPETDEIIESLVTPSRASVIFGEPIDLSDIDRSGPATRKSRPRCPSVSSGHCFPCKRGRSRSKNERPWCRLLAIERRSAGTPIIYPWFPYMLALSY